MPVEPAPLPVDNLSPADPEPDLPPPVDVASDGDYSWYDAIEFSAFVDAYASVNYNMPKPQVGRNSLRTNDIANGFALSWVGVNASYPADPVGATINLRFGPTANTVAGSCVSDDKSLCDSAYGLQFVKQAFGSWKPGGADGIFQLDLGKFDTPFGAEVLDSQLNINYTRGILFYSQPLFHTGLRASFAVSEAFDFKLLAVNGWNNTIDNNVGKSLGAQLNFHVKKDDGADVFGASIGYLGGPERDDTRTIGCGDGTEFSASTLQCVASPASRSRQDVVDSGLDKGVVDAASNNTKGLRHLIDLVVTASPIDRLLLVLNADFGVERRRSSPESSSFDSHTYYGAMLGARFAVVDQFGIGVRGEYFRDNGGFVVADHPELDVDLLGGTLTLDYLPSDFLTIRLDNRLDWASYEIFNKDVRGHVGNQFTTTLGVVAHTN
ncbi:MAG: porin [Myxococcales bacterium]|nr:MAG: porin [Myxococcales bacterium]